MTISTPLTDVSCNIPGNFFTQERCLDGKLLLKYVTTTMTLSFFMLPLDLIPLIMELIRGGIAGSRGLS